MGRFSEQLWGDSPERDQAGRPTHDGRHLHLVAPPATHTWEQLELGDGDFDVDTPDLAQRYGIEVDVEDLA